MNTATAAYRILGTTDEVTTCEHCGRDDLRGTVVLAALDDEGDDTGERIYFGSTCGAKAAGWTTARKFREAAENADRAKGVALRKARDARFAEWVRETYAVTITGPRDLYGVRNREATGAEPAAILDRYRGETGETV
jgi:hypothetical protein